MRSINLQPSLNLEDINVMAGRFEKLEKWIYEKEAGKLRIIFVHDIQDYETSSHLKTIVSNLPNAVVIENYFGGPGPARNAGLELVRSGWVTFWDSDDIPEVTEVMKMINNASESGQEIALGGFNVKLLNSEKSATRHLIQESNQRTLFEEIGINPGLWRWAFQRTLIENTRFMPFRMAEDQCFLFDLKFMDNEIYIHNKAVYTYFIGDENQLTRNSKAISDLLRSVPYLIDAMRGCKPSTSAFGATLITRQIFTALRRGNIITRIRMFVLIIRILPTVLITKRKAFVAAFEILINKRRPLTNDY